MSQLIFQATCINARLKALQASAECKNLSDSDYCTLSIQSRLVTSEKGETTEVQVLYGTTCHPSFSMGIQLLLTGGSAIADETAVRVRTRDLISALSSFGQKTVCLELIADGGLRISTLRRADNDNQRTDQPTRTISVQGQSVAFEQLPDALPDTTATLPDSIHLREGLQGCASVAAVRGNRPVKSGVRLTCTADHLHMESQNPNVRAEAQYTEPWQVEPAEEMDVILSPDSIRHLCTALASNVNEQPVKLHFDAEKSRLTVQTDTLTMHCEVN